MRNADATLLSRVSTALAAGLLALLGTQASALPATCGSAITMGALRGSYSIYGVTDSCSSPWELWNTTLDRDGLSLLFAAMLTKGGGCSWTVIALRNRELNEIARTQEDPFGPIAASFDGTFWTISSGNYLHILTNGTAIRQQPFVQGFRVQAIGADRSGKVYALEIRDRKVGWEQQLVDVSTSKHFSVPGNGLSNADGFLVGADSRAYFKVLGQEGGLYQVQSEGLRHVRAASLTSAHDIAVAKDGSVWQAALLGVSHINATGVTAERIGPIAQVPCAIINTAALTPRNPIVQGDDSVWFTYDALYRVSQEGAVSRTPLPLNLMVRKLLPATNGSIWLIGQIGNQGAFVNFRPRE